MDVLIDLATSSSSSKTPERNEQKCLTPSSEEEAERLGYWQTVQQVFTTYLGSGILSTGFGFAMGGWSMAVVLLLITAWFGCTGMMLVECFERVELERTRTKQGALSLDAGFCQVAAHLSGGHGIVWSLTTVSLLIEFIGLAIVFQILVWECIATSLNCFTTVSRLPVVLGCVLLTAPAVLLPPIMGPESATKALQLFATAGSFAALAVVVVVSAMLLVYSSSISFYSTPEHTRVLSGDNIGNIGLGASVLFTCFTGHAGLPPIRARMKDSSQFPSCFKIGYTLLVLVYAWTGMASYLLFGADCQLPVTNSLAVLPGNGINVVVGVLTLSFAVKLWSSLPFWIMCLVSISKEFAEKCFAPILDHGGKEKQKHYFLSFDSQLTAASYMLCTAGSYVGYDGLPYISGLVGANSMLICATLPCVLYAYGLELSSPRGVMQVTAVAAGIALVGCSMFASISSWTGNAAEAQK
jgi:hypothetical protein